MSRKEEEGMVYVAGAPVSPMVLVPSILAVLTEEEMAFVDVVDEEKFVEKINERTVFATMDEAVEWLRQCLRDLRNEQPSTL